MNSEQILKKLDWGESEQGFKDRANQLIQDGLMTPEKITERLRKAQDDRLDFHRDVNMLDEVFERYCAEESSTKHWTECIFTNYLTERYSSSPIIRSAGPLLYRSALYHAYFPFKAPEPALLTRDALKAALVMMTKLQQECIGGHTSLGGKTALRERTEIDRCRVLFRSFAKPKPGSTALWTLVDDDALDLLDVVSHTQPEEIMVNPVPEQFLTPVLGILPQQQYGVDDLQIPKADLYILLQLLVAVAVGNTWITEQCMKAPQEVAAVASSLSVAFLGPDATGVNWRVFHRVFSETMPRLFNGIDRVLEVFFQPIIDSEDDAKADPGGEPEEDDDEDDLIPPRATLLTYPLLSHLALFAPAPTYFLNAQPTKYLYLNSLLPLYLSGTNPPNLSDLTSAVVPSSSPSLLLISGTAPSPSSHRVIVGAYLPHTWGASTLPPLVQPHNSILTDTVVFTLEPTHAVYRCPPDVSPEVLHSLLTENGILFGEGKPVDLSRWLKSGFCKEGQDGKGLYRSCSVAKGKSEERASKFTVEKVEVWKFDTSGVAEEMRFPFQGFEGEEQGVYEQYGLDRKLFSVLCGL